MHQSPTRVIRHLVPVAALVAVTAPAAARQVEAPSYVVYRVDGSAPVIDGRLDDAVWNRSVWGEDFRTPQGADPSQRTTFAVRYDDANVYVGIHLFDSSPDEITKTPGARDDTNGDRIATFFDVNLDKESSYVFVINAAGVVRDQYGSDGEGWDNGWDTEWAAGMHTDDGGWTAELRIPLAAMDVETPAGQEWGFQLTRVVERLQEMAFWSQPTRAGFTDSFGRIRFQP